MGVTHDLGKQMETIRRDPAAEWNVTFGVDWRVLDAFSTNYDDSVTRLASALGLTLTSEDRSGIRIYRLSGTGSQLLKLLEPVNSDLNQLQTMPFKLTGRKGLISDAQFKIAQRCAEMGLGFRPTVYSSMLSATLVADVSGPLADVVTLLWDARDAVNRAMGLPGVAARRPPHAPVTAAPPDRGVA